MTAKQKADEQKEPSDALQRMAKRLDELDKQVTQAAGISNNRDLLDNIKKTKSAVVEDLLRLRGALKPDEPPARPASPDRADAMVLASGAGGLGLESTLDTVKKLSEMGVPQEAIEGLIYGDPPKSSFFGDRASMQVEWNDDGSVKESFFDKVGDMAVRAVTGQPLLGDVSPMPISADPDALVTEFCECPPPKKPSFAYQRRGAQYVPCLNCRKMLPAYCDCEEPERMALFTMMACGKCGGSLSGGDRKQRRELRERRERDAALAREETRVAMEAGRREGRIVPLGPRGYITPEAFAAIKTTSDGPPKKPRVASPQGRRRVGFKD